MQAVTEVSASDGSSSSVTRGLGRDNNLCAYMIIEHLAYLLLAVRGSVRRPFVGIHKQSFFLLTAERIGVPVAK
jgi:hypothetical protein